MKKTSNNSKFVVKRSYPGSGLGLYALAPFKKGEFVIEYKGKKIPTPLAENITTKYLFEIDEKWTIDGSDRKYANESRYMNHSCNPNCESDTVDDRVIISAIKNIEEGEELTFDYGKEYFDEFIKPMGCKCASCVKKRAAKDLKKKVAA